LHEQIHHEADYNRGNLQQDAALFQRRRPVWQLENNHPDKCRERSYRQISEPATAIVRSRTREDPCLAVMQVRRADQIGR
jgi:hypothetical protein